MDHLPSQEVLSLWLNQYGALAIFTLLALGIIALPIPEETLMVLAGILMSNDQLNIPSTIIAAYLGSMFGITVSYLIGKTAGNYFLNKYGPWIGLTESKFLKVQSWFEHYGKWTLSFGYFIAGLRHLTGIFAGVMGLGYRQFAMYAYGGAFVWASTFLSIGYFFGDYWMSAYATVTGYVEEIIIAILAIIVIVASILIYKKFKKNG